MREVVLDTETTGLDPRNGDRIVEIGCLELLNHVPTGRHYHTYLNPDRSMPAEAFAVHGLSDAHLKDQPRFAAVVDAFLTFLGESPLVIHNAAFDLGFINAELGRLGVPPVPAERAIDTVLLARKAYPGMPANLDALCRRFQIDTSTRTLHGALTDARLLAEVYLQLKGGRQPGLALVSNRGAKGVTGPGPTRTPRLLAPTAAEEAAHGALVGRLKNPLWGRLR
ncbi:MAG: DNA polymerase III subunit epsilon [Defluviicoccus sp.]